MQDKYWEALTVQERLDVLQTVANIEQRYLGLPIELNVGAANLNAGNLGYYSDETHEIVINMDGLLFDSSLEVLDTVCHESFHSYQYCMIEALNCLDERIGNLRIFQKAHVYAYEFENYINGETDLYNYYYQNCKSDARDYAEEAVHEYYNRINSYLDEGA